MVNPLVNKDCYLPATLAGNDSSGARLPLPHMRNDLRARKRQRYLDTAVQIVLRDGFDGLTMTAIAREVDAAVGTIYGYFPSKGALVAELQVYAIEAIVGAWIEARERWSKTFVEHGLDQRRRLLAELLAFGSYFVAIQRDYPEEFRLQQMQLAERRELFDGVDVTKLAPAAMALLRGPFELLEEASAAGAIDGADLALDRAASLALALNGVALAENVQVAKVFLPVLRLTDRIVVDLLVGWGAERSELSELLPLVSTVVAGAPLTQMPRYLDHQAARGIDLTDGADLSVELDGAVSLDPTPLAVSPDVASPR